MNKKNIFLGLVVLVIAIIGFIISRTQVGTFQVIFNIFAILVIILISLLFFRKKS
ncbi:hypothetical protein M3661_14635 [Paenibacillus sp. MER 180]|uniref:hypothetical protein n=1 Tax=unclassified Paenibacillus TaxID=185978 RepID=UPI000AF2FBBA|nr:MULTISPECIES: hypothetical protein [unclassified Paenibacillus]MCM3291366.1 hypothetical protein [Paenibacillus sp. MER 180]